MVFYVTHNDGPYKNMLAYFAENGFTKFKVTIKEHKKKRSLDQNAYYWAILGIIGKDKGYEPNELHEALKVKVFGLEKRKTILGDEYEKTKSSADLNTKEFSVLLDAAHELAVIFGVNLPMPSHYGMS